MPPSLLSSSLPPSLPFFSSSSKSSPTPPLKLAAAAAAASNSPDKIATTPQPTFRPIPTAPWMKSPPPLHHHHQPQHHNPKDKKPNADRSLTEKVKGGRSRHAMRSIIRSVARLRDLQPPESDPTLQISVPPHGEDEEEGRFEKVPWAAADESRMVFRREKKTRAAMAAEREIPGEELARLRREARRVCKEKWVKAKKAGLTSEVVDEIRRVWKGNEIVVVKFVEPLGRNMDRAMEIVETKTGGLVVWIKKDMLAVYRGSNYQLNGSMQRREREAEYSQLSSTNTDLEKGEGLINETLYEREANRLLDGLGPRYVDWWWRKPLPVDADLLPEVVHGFKTPFRLCPPQERSKLRDEELMYLRKLAHPLPTHFALSKNTRLQGLAAAIIKLWEKSLIAKIAIKVGIPNTNNEQMAYELKRLTGGVLILRNKFFIILYRGRDFLPGTVAKYILERESELNDQQLQEEEARSKALEAYVIEEAESRTSNIGTFSEFQDIQANYLSLNRGISEEKVQIEAEKENLEKELRDNEHKLLLLKLKIEKSDKELAKLNSTWSPSEQSADGELLTEEERQSFIKVGLKMDEFLLLGRRGIYEGIIESIHQHWKHREVVKVLTMQEAFHQINHSAKLLEIESGGILVSVEKLRKGHAIIIYRGKNYKRPMKPTSENLLTKREALQRSIEIQRRGSLKYFAYQRQQMIRELQQRLRHLEHKVKGLSPRDPVERSERLS